jgi:c-di-GMP-binding flagellar brake protein YcgR
MAGVVSSQDRRRDPRVPINPAFAETDPRTTTPVSNLSASGVFVVTDQLYPLGARIELRFVVFPDDPQVFSHTGRVMRHSHDPPGMGVEFDPVSQALQLLIERIVTWAEEDTRRRSSHRRTRSKRFVFHAHNLQTKIVDD